MVDEAHVTTFAVHPRYRRRRIGERLLLALLDLSVDRHAREATLEVRLSNLAARRLYEKYGFRPVGIRPRYYSDNQEDALIMTTEPLDAPSMRERIARLRAALDAAPAPCRRARPRVAGRPRATTVRRPAAAPPAPGAARHERPAAPGGRVVLRRDRHRARRGRPADPRQRRRQPGRAPRADRRHRARGRGAGPPALDRAGAGRGPRRRPASPWRDVDARRRHLRARARGLAARRHQLRQDAGLGARQAARAGQPPRGPRVRGLAARPGRGRARDAAVPAGRAGRVRRPHLPGRDARPPQLPAAGPDAWTTRPARRSTRSAACSVSATRAGPRSRAPPRPRPPTTASSRGPGWATRTTCSFSGLKTAARRIVREARADEGLPPDEREGAAAGRRRRRAGVGLPGLGRGRAGDEDDPGGRGDRRPGDRAGRRRGGEPGAAGRGSPARPRRAASRW